jgi:hypothetical protein
MTTPATPWHSNSSLSLREIIRRGIEDNKVFALGARDISLPFVPAEVTEFSVDSVCTVADIEAARTAIIRAIPALEEILVALAAAGNILGKNDDELTAQELREKYDTEEGWGQHPRFTMEGWRNEVSNEDTRIGYPAHGTSPTLGFQRQPSLHSEPLVDHQSNVPRAQVRVGRRSMQSSLFWACSSSPSKHQHSEMRRTYIAISIFERNQTGIGSPVLMGDFLGDLAKQ